MTLSRVSHSRQRDVARQQTVCRRRRRRHLAREVVGMHDANGRRQGPEELRGAPTCQYCLVQASKPARIWASSCEGRQLEAATMYISSSRLPPSAWSSCSPALLATTASARACADDIAAIRLRAGEASADQRSAAQPWALDPHPHARPATHSAHRLRAPLSCVDQGSVQFKRLLEGNVHG